MSKAYDELRQRMREAATLYSVASLLGWDQETMMPPKAGGFRAEELALITRLAHERSTDPRIEELLAQCETDDELTSIPAADIQEILSLLRADIVHCVLEFPPLRFFQGVEIVFLALPDPQHLLAVQVLRIFKHPARVRHVRPIQVHVERFLRNVVVASHADPRP